MKSNRVITLLAGMGIGALITWLFTSKKGEAIRKQIKDEVDDLVNQVKAKKTDQSNP